MTTISLSAWAAKVDGKYLDLDGAPAQAPCQCMDVWLSCLVDVHGGRVEDGHAGGTEYADQVWRLFPTHRPALMELFRKVRTTRPKRGDIVFWHSYKGGLPHVAVAIADAANGTVRCMTQNPDKAHRENLTCAGIIGVLRPIGKEDPVTEAEIQKIANAVLDTKVKQSNGKTTTLRRQIALGHTRALYAHKVYARNKERFEWLKKRLSQ